MERLARLVMHHRLVVSLVWLALFAGGMISAGQVGDRLTLDFSLPGQPGDTAEQQLIDNYGASSFDTYVAVVTVPEGETVEDNLEAVDQVFAAAESAAAKSAQPNLTLRVVDFESTGDDGFITDDGRTTFALIQAPIPVTFGPYIEAELEPALEKAAESKGFETGVTSYGMLSQGGDTEGPSVLVETLFGAAGALLVLDLRLRIVPRSASACSSPRCRS